VQSVDNLQLQNDGILHDHIELVSAVQLDSLVEHGKVYLAF